MSVNIIIDPYFESNESPSQNFGDSNLYVVVNNSNNIEIAANTKYFTIIVKDNDTSAEVWKDHWWEGGSTPDNSDVDYFNDTINKNYLYAVSMTLSDSSDQKTSQTITQSLVTYFNNNSFEWSNIEHILSNNGYDTIEFTLDRSEEQQTIRKLTISYDTQKVTKLEYSFSDDPNSFVEYDVIDEQNINSGVIIGSGLQYLFVRPTKAVSENTIDQTCFNSLNNLSFVGYDNATESWKFSLTSGYTSVGLVITTTTRNVNYTFNYSDNDNNTTLQLKDGQRTTELTGGDTSIVSVKYGTTQLNAEIINASVSGKHLASVSIKSENGMQQEVFSAKSDTYTFTVTLPEYDEINEGNNEISIESSFDVNTHTLYISVDPRDASSLVVVTLGEDQTPQSFNNGLSVDTGKPVHITASTDALYDNITISSDSLILSTVGNTASFNMPDNDVTINITYEQNEQVDTHTLTVVTNPANIQSNANITINGVYTSSGNYPKDEEIIIGCKDSFEYEDYVYTLSSNNELRFLMPDDNTTVTVSYDRKPKKLKVRITTDPDNMKETINGFSIVGDGEYNPGTLVNLSWNYNGSTDAFTYNKNRYEFVCWKIGNSLDEHPSTSITVTEDIDIKLIFKKTAITQNQTYYLGDSYQKHYRFKIQYKNAQTDPIILDWYPIVYDYGVNE